MISFSILSLWSSSSHNVFVPSLHIQKGLENLKAHVRSNGLRPRVRGNEKGIPHNGTPYVSLQHVVSFIENYAGREGLSLPGRVPGYKTIHPSSFCILPPPKKTCGDAINMQRRLEGTQLWDKQNLFKLGTNSFPSLK